MNPPSRQRALVDSNVWRYFVDQKAGGTLVRLARAGQYDVLIAPAVVYEAIRTKQPSLRVALVRLMTQSAFCRLMPEAYSESREILDEIARLRPHWLRKHPDLEFYNRLRNDWKKSTGGFWVRSKRWPEREGRYLAESEKEMIDGARRQATIARREMMDTDWKCNPPMDKTSIEFKFAVPGWRGDKVEAWRADSFIGLSHGLGITGNAYRDWLAPFIDLDHGLLSSAEWAEFWFYEIAAPRAPRQWIRWAPSFAQRFRKVTLGTPGDSQLSTYFVDADVVVSADKIFLEILEEIRPYSPIELPRGHLIPAAKEGVAATIALLTGT